MEKAAQVAKRNGLRSSKAIRRIVERMAVEAAERKAEKDGAISRKNTP